MPYDPFKHHRRSIRLKNYDYAQAGAYFVTIVIRDPELSLGEIVDGEMQVNEFGAIVQLCWDDLPAHFPNVELDAFVIMPNHVHGVVVINEPNERRGAVTAPNDDAVTAPNPGEMNIPNTGGTLKTNAGGKPRLYKMLPHTNRRWDRSLDISNINPPNASTNCAVRKAQQFGNATILNTSFVTKTIWRTSANTSMAIPRTGRGMTKIPTAAPNKSPLAIFRPCVTMLKTDLTPRPFPAREGVGG